MPRLIAFLVCVLAFSARLEAQTDSTIILLGAEISRFQLFNECRPMVMFVDIQGDKAKGIELTEERVRTMAESRLRAARLYADTLATAGGMINGWLHISILTLDDGPAFTTSVEYSKFLRDPVTGRTLMAMTWDTRLFGTHGDNAGFIMNGLSEMLDGFLLEYLRMNEDSCE